MNMDQLQEKMLQELDQVVDLKTLNDLRVKYLGKKGLITELNGEIKNVANEDKKAFGQKVNGLRSLFQSHYDDIKNYLEEEELNQILKELV